ncbi:MAG: VOC family protein [Planctomycetes bacterium]|nr:VOC family protein [Planctomycetota bacterium]
MWKHAKAIPEGYHTVTPSLIVEDVAVAIDFYVKAFGAREVSRFNGPDDRIIHAEIEIGDAKIMLGPSCAESRCLAPSQLSGTSCCLYLYLPDVDAAFQRAVGAGARSTMAVEDTFWGDRAGQVADPFGHCWFLATHQEDLTDEQMRERAEEFFASHAGAH